jgi:hypothetical protein
MAWITTPPKAASDAVKVLQRPYTSNVASLRQALTIDRALVSRQFKMELAVQARMTRHMTIKLGRPGPRSMSHKGFLPFKLLMRRNYA